MKTFAGYFDSVLSRLRARAEEAGYDIADGYCGVCGVKLTEADLEAGACTNCGAVIDDKGDSDDA